MKVKREDMCQRCGVVMDVEPNVDYRPLCPACAGKPQPKRDHILERPEEEPGYGHGV